MSKDVGDLVAVDFFGPLPVSVWGATWIFVVMDIFSKYTRLFALRWAAARAAAIKLNREVGMEYQLNQC